MIPERNRNPVRNKARKRENEWSTGKYKRTLIAIIVLTPNTVK